jgi:hypothetical protein
MVRCDPTAWSGSVSEGGRCGEIIAAAGRG